MPAAKTRAFIASCLFAFFNSSIGVAAKSSKVRNTVSFRGTVFEVIDCLGCSRDTFPPRVHCHSGRSVNCKSQFQKSPGHPPPCSHTPARAIAIRLPRSTDAMHGMRPPLVNHGEKSFALRQVDPGKSIRTRFDGGGRDEAPPAKRAPPPHYFLDAPASNSILTA
jgi:hypothetical protein